MSLAVIDGLDSGWYFDHDGKSDLIAAAMSSGLWILKQGDDGAWASSLLTKMHLVLSTPAMVLILTKMATNSVRDEQVHQQVPLGRSAVRTRVANPPEHHHLEHCEWGVLITFTLLNCVALVVWV